MIFSSNADPTKLSFICKLCWKLFNSLEHYTCIALVKISMWNKSLAYHNTHTHAHTHNYIYIGVLVSCLYSMSTLRLFFVKDVVKLWFSIIHSTKLLSSQSF